jgi:hypothetical protein
MKYVGLVFLVLPLFLFLYRETHEVKPEAHYKPERFHNEDTGQILSHLLDKKIAANKTASISSHKQQQQLQIIKEDPKDGKEVEEYKMNVDAQQSKNATSKDSSKLVNSTSVDDNMDAPASGSIKDAGSTGNDALNGEEKLEFNSESDAEETETIRKRLLL